MSANAFKHSNQSLTFYSGADMGKARSLRHQSIYISGQTFQGMGFRVHVIGGHHE